MEPLVILLETAAPDLRALSALALAALAADTDVRRRVWAAQAVPPLVRALHELPSRGLEGAATALECLASLREAAEQMVEAPVSETGLEG